MSLVSYSCWVSESWHTAGSAPVGAFQLPIHGAAGEEWLGSWARQRCLGLCCADALHPSSPKLIVIYKYEPSEPLKALVR